MAALRINILSNYAGQIWMAAMAVVFLPLYIRILGMEAFGLVGLIFLAMSYPASLATRYFEAKTTTGRARQ